MAVSTCIKCGGHSFEQALLTPLGDSSQIEALTHQIAAIDERLNRIAKALQD
jgi:hypothetical protein